MSTVEASDSAGFFVTFCRNFIHFRHTFSASNYYRSYVLIIGEQLMKVVGAALLVTAMCAQVYASEVAKADSAPAYFGLSGHLFRFHPARRFGVIRPA